MIIKQGQFYAELVENDCYAKCNTGQGSIIFADGSSYTGSLQNGLFNGPGVYQYSNGTIIEMDFNDNQLNGKAT